MASAGGAARRPRDRHRGTLGGDGRRPRRDRRRRAVRRRPGLGRGRRQPGHGGVPPSAGRRGRLRGCRRHGAHRDRRRRELIGAAADRRAGALVRSVGGGDAARGRGRGAPAPRRALPSRRARGRRCCGGRGHEHRLRRHARPAVRLARRAARPGGRDLPRWPAAGRRRLARPGHRPCDRRPRDLVAVTAAATGRRWGLVRRRAALASIVVGLALAFATAATGRLAGPPLYDGVTQVEPYVWLDPPPNHPGNPSSGAATLPVKGGSSPLVTVATQELMPPATTSLQVSITPVQPTALPTDGHILGNVYRILVTTQAGSPVTAPASAKVSVILMAPDPTTTQATMGLFANGTWTTLDTTPEGQAAEFLAVITQFGDFALIGPGVGPSAVASAGPGATVAGGTPVIGPPTVVPGSETPGGGIPTVTIAAGIAIGLVLAGLVAVAMLPGRRRRAVDRDGWSRRPPPRTRR